ncbi:MAG: hypothetical protein L0Z62_27605 [Gemmataceae bacterium]|nr:hypothetical protein [Gemmataceae bacterium]
MGKTLAAVLAGWLWLALGGHAHAQEAEARALIEKAVKAQGGLDKLDKSVAAYRKSKGAFLTDGFTFTGESYSEPGNRRRLVLQGKTKEVPGTRVLVLVDDKGWISFDGVTYDLDKEFLARIHRSIYADRVCALVTLLRDKGYTLTVLGESQIKDKAVLGVKVQSEGKPDVSLYFDKTTGLLFKSAVRMMDPNLGREALQEVYYYDYKRYDAAEPDERALNAAKVTTDGKGLIEFLRRRTPDEAEQVRIKDLIIKLGNRSFAVRQKATAALKECGIKAAGLLREALRNADLEVKRRAQQCLDHVTQGPDTGLSAAAVRLLALSRPAGAVEVLLAYHPCAPDETTQREVQGALAALAQEGGKPNPVLAKALKDPNPQRRAVAAAALGQDGGAFLKQGWRRVPVADVLMATRSELYRDGQHMMDLATTELHYFNRLDDSLFTRP